MHINYNKKIQIYTCKRIGINHAMHMEQELPAAQQQGEWKICALEHWAENKMKRSNYFGKSVWLDQIKIIASMLFTVSLFFSRGRTKENEPFARHGREIRKSDPDGLPLGCRPVLARRKSKRTAASCAGLGKGKKNEKQLAILDPW